MTILMVENFKTKAGEFEGPLDHLLDLVEKHKLHISQVSLAQITDEYVDYLNRQSGLPLDEMASFVLVASTLMLIKSLTLLPDLAITQEETVSIDDLERRLKLLESVRRLAGGVRGKFGRTVMFPRSERRLEPVFTPSREIVMTVFLPIWRSIVNALPKPEMIPHTVVQRIMSLEEMIEKLAGRVAAAFRLKFSEFVKDQRKEKVSVIISFLGLLELVKQGIIDVRQESHFSEIDMETKVAAVPRYF